VTELPNLGAAKPQLPIPGPFDSESVVDFGRVDDSVVNVAETPELGAVTLFGTGLAGMGSYALARWRSRRRPPTD
jgi:hypothetical protein